MIEIESTLYRFELRNVFFQVVSWKAFCCLLNDLKFDQTSNVVNYICIGCKH